MEYEKERNLILFCGKTLTAKLTMAGVRRTRPANLKCKLFIRIYFFYYKTHFKKLSFSRACHTQTVRGRPVQPPN